MPTLEWIGKDKVINHHQQVPYRVLEEKYTYNAEKSDNMIIRGDNLEALKALLPKYEGRIKCIYIDPPYNTGNEGWVYNDNVNDPKIKKWLGEVVGKEGEDLSRHDKWLCMMYPRLKLLQRLLSDDGAIFISIDDKGLIKNRISKMNCVNDKELQDYIDRIVETMSEDQLSDMEQSTYPYIVKIEKKVKDLLTAHRANVFNLWLEQGKITCKPNYALSPVISPTSFFSTYPKSLYSSEEDVNDYERKVVWALSSMDNIKWWHRNISRLGFQINGAVHAYPDIIAMTTSGKILMIETKGDHLENEESKAKAKIGQQWDNLAGPMYRYFMVFQSKALDWPGAYSYDRFMEIAKCL